MHVQMRGNSKVITGCIGILPHLMSTREDVTKNTSDRMSATRTEILGTGVLSVSWRMGDEMGY